jgi:hypothetical protein
MTTKIYLLPKKPGTEYKRDVGLEDYTPFLPFIQEFGLSEKVVNLLCTPIRWPGKKIYLYKDGPVFSIISALRYVRGQLNCSLPCAKDYVDKIQDKYLDTIARRRVNYVKKWRKKHGVHKAVSGQKSKRVQNPLLHRKRKD